MLGDYGETLVIDWGLAKRLHDFQGSAAPGGCGAPALPRDDLPEGTATGDLLGTPAFMSPEQAAGRPDAVGRASDIYSLGATLYALLTGRSPFDGDYGGDLLRRVSQGDFPPPRQVRPDTPRALEAICLKAMAREPANRYATALELDADLERWLAGEPVSAYREPWTARSCRWIRRHRTVVVSLVAVLAVTGLLVGAFGGWLAARQANTVRAIRADLEDTTRFEREEQWADARASLQRAEGRLSEGGPEDVRQLIAGARADLHMVAQLDNIRLGRSVLSNDTLEVDTADTAGGYAKAFRDYGLELEGEATTAANVVRQSVIKAQLLGGLDDWAEYTPDAQVRARILAIACQADPDPWRDRFRDSKLGRDTSTLKRLVGEASIDSLSPMVLEALVHRLDRAGIEDPALLRQIQARFPQDYFLNSELMAYTAHLAERLPWPEADLAYEEAIGFARAMLAARPDSAWGWSDLGVLLFGRGRMRESEAAHRKAVSLQPDNPRFIATLSTPLRELGRFDEAEKAARTAIRLKPDYGIAYSCLANTLLLQKRYLEAEKACHTAIKLIPRHPWPYYFLSQILRARGSTSEAEALEKEVEKLRPGSMSKLRLRPWERAALLESKLPEWLHGKAKPADALELTVLGFMAAHRLQRYDATAQLFGKSFAEQPAFAEATVDHPADRPRYFAACCAAQASRGLGDGAWLKPEAREQRRRQALEWLRQELSYWDKQMVLRQSTAYVRAYKALSYWRQDGWLAGVLDVAITDKLPQVEKEACRRLWDEVAELLKRASAGLDEAKTSNQNR
jgi:tetratricopeptide (TPR) repeat protein